MNRDLVAIPIPHDLRPKMYDPDGRMILVSRVYAADEISNQRAADKMEQEMIKRKHK